MFGVRTGDEGPKNVLNLLSRLCWIAQPSGGQYENPDSRLRRHGVCAAHESATAISTAATHTVFLIIVLRSHCPAGDDTLNRQRDDHRRQQVLPEMLTAFLRCDIDADLPRRHIL